MEGCAACGKSDSNLKACKGCRLVKYCNVDCQVAHRSEHKHACQIKAAILLDEKLFAEPPPRKECVICCVLMPHESLRCWGETIYLPCCGQILCASCRYRLTRQSCPYCKESAPSNYQEIEKRLLERINRNDARAMLSLGYLYSNEGVPEDVHVNVDHKKAFEMYQNAALHGNASAHFRLGEIYNYTGGERVVQQDKMKAVHHWHQAAMMGHEEARINLGIIEGQDNKNVDRAMRHFIYAAKLGSDSALQTVKEGYMAKVVTKDDFAIALRGHQASQDEVHSEDRAKHKEAIEIAKLAREGDVMARETLEEATRFAAIRGAIKSRADFFLIDLSM